MSRWKIVLRAHVYLKYDTSARLAAACIIHHRGQSHVNLFPAAGFQFQMAWCIRGALICDGTYKGVHAPMAVASRSSFDEMMSFPRLLRH